MTLTLRLASALALHAMVFASTLGAQRVVPVHEEPRHRLVFEGGGLRVLDVQIAPGDTSLYHLHATPILYTNISPSRTIEQLVGGNWPAPGTPPILQWVAGGTLSDTIYPVRPKSHRVTNIGDRLFRLMAVVTTEGTPRPFTTAISDELPGTPELSSSWFRQTRVTLSPQGTMPWKQTTRTVVAILPMTGSAEIERDGGAPTVLSTPGAFAVIAAGSRYRVRSHYAVDARRIYLLGQSGGGHMTMLMTARHPDLWAAASAWVGISDLRDWYATHRADSFGQMMRGCFGGDPASRAPAAAEARARSPISHLNARLTVPLDLAAGRFDSIVSITHSLRAIRAVAPQSVTDEEIALLTGDGTGLQRPAPSDTASDPLLGRRIFLRRTTGTSRITIFDGGHEWVPRAAVDWLARHRKP